MVQSRLQIFTSVQLIVWKNGVRNFIWHNVGCEEEVS